LTKHQELKIFTGNANRKLAEDICRVLRVKLGNADISKFSDSDTKVKLLETVRGKDVYLIQSTCNPTNDHLMELLVMIDACKRSSAKCITAVMPWYGYARQDYMPGPRQPISAKLVANLLTTAGADRIMAIDLHSPSIQGFFDIPVERISAIALQCDYLKAMKLKNFVIAAPDAGGVKRAKKFADILGVELVVINKYRPKENVAEAMSVIGDVLGKNVVIVDDMVDTAGSIKAGAEILKKNGAKDVYVLATHAPLSGPAIERINESQIREVILTDTIPLNGKKCAKIKVISVAKLLAEAIRRAHTNEPMSEPFKFSQTNISAFI
jgi:ribose-phosphate pyrophosphokinase